MKTKILYGIWAALFILCAGLSFIQERSGGIQLLLSLLAVGFFVPGAILLYQGIREKNRKRVLLIRILSIVSLSLTLLLLVINVVSVGWSEAAGDAAYGFLAVLSVPMLCFRSWVAGIFLWGCLLSASFLLPKKPDTP